jgi:uncharacterized protein YdeI (YjbR/CyaY-like superfamily)
MTFRTTVMLAGKTATGIVIPDEVVDALGAGRRVKVSLTVNGYTYRTTVAPMNGRYMAPLAAEHRTAAGVAAGDEVEVSVALDDAPRVVELPEDLAAAIDADPAARAHFESLSFTYRKEWVRWVTEAKKPETRQSRIEKTVRGLLAGDRTH